MQRFDALAEATGAAIAYVHHDAKGISSERNIRDRGAGSNVVGRDYDVCFTLTPHEEKETMAVAEVLLRNYAPQDPVVINWTGAFFDVLDKPPPVAARGKAGRPATPEAGWYADKAMELIGEKAYQRTVLKDMLASRLAVAGTKAGAIITVLEESGKLKKHVTKTFPKRTFLGTAEAIKKAAQPTQEEMLNETL